MAKKRVSKSVKRRLTFLGPILLGIVIFCIFTIFSYAYQIHQLKLEEQKLENELKNLQTEERELSSEIVKLKDPEYIAKYARENYLYSMEGEYVIKIEDKKEEVKESDNTNDKIYYIMGITISILIVLLIAVIIKIVKNKKSKYLLFFYNLNSLVAFPSK